MESVLSKKITINPISPKFKMLYRKMRYKILYGGRGSGKSYAVVEALIYYAMTYNVRVLCCREIQKSIKESSYKLIVDMIMSMGLVDEFYITQNSIICKKTKAEFIFMGLHANVTSIQSIVDIDICWVEEGQSISTESWKILTPSIRGIGSEIWVSLNPWLPSDVICKNFIEREHVNSVVVKINYLENPKCPQVLLDEANDMLVNNPDMYEHVWLGDYMKQGSNNLFKFSELLAATKRIGVAKQDGLVVAGFDVARFGDDSSALVIRNHGRIIFAKKYHNQKIFTTCKQVLEELYKYNVDTVVVDGGGLGAGAVEKLNEINTRINLSIVEFSGAFAAQDIKLLNARVETYKALAKWIKEEYSALPTDSDELIEELSVMKYEFATGSDKIKLNSKDDIKKIIGRSTDISDALSMTFYNTGTKQISKEELRKFKQKIFGH